MAIQIRKLTINDREALASMANNRKIWNLVRDKMPHPYSLEDADRFIAMKKDQLEDFVFAIDCDSRFSGMIGLHPQGDVYKRSMELGYWIGEDYWGRGIASEAVRQILEFGFSLEGINRIFAGVLENNSASKRVLEKNAFVFEGIARKSAWKNEELLDEWKYSILKEDYQAKTTKHI